MPKPTGLTSSQVADRRAKGQVNTTEHRTSRTVAAIVRANVLTRFNAIISGLLVVILIYGEPPDALFGLVMVVNSGIGIVQEIRAKRTLDSLRHRIAPTATVIRDGTEMTIPATEIVLGELVAVRTGDAVPVDGRIVQSDGLEIDESSLTGESDPVAKSVDDEVRSSSAVVAGSGLVTATAVGADAWAHQLTSKAREFSLTESGLRKDIDRLLGWIMWVIVPVGVLLFATQMSNAPDVASGLVSTVSGMVAMIPQGLVLLVSLSFAVAALRLSERNVVVQELAAVEGLARVDVVCLDKTGTLTTGTLEVESISCLGDEQTVLAGLAVLAKSDRNPTATLAVVARTLPAAESWVSTATVPFSSARKWSAASFDGFGTWVVGAPEVLLDAMEASPTVEALREQVASLAKRGRRLLLVGRTEVDLDDRVVLPSHLTPAAIVVIREELRPDAAETLRYLRSQGVAVKVISGDHPQTVSAVATELGLPDADRAVDMRRESDLTAIAPDVVVFGRVLPEQKRGLLAQLQERGHTVAMTGDGVNDVLALKQADIGIAMDTASSATKAVSQFVLLDGRYDRLPTIVGEGRRVIANMERASALFLTKTVYAVLLAVWVSLAGIAFPFLPRHLTLVGALTIGIPAFVLSFWPSNRPARPGYLERTLHFAIPAGLTAAIMTFAVYATVHTWVGASVEEAQTAATLTLALVGFWILYRLIRPLGRGETVLITMLMAGLVAAFLLPPSAEFFALEFPSTAVALSVTAATIVNIVALELIVALAERHGEHIRWLTAR
ncbi:MAG: HAD-IC family P-type ATPase [Acidimicrobiia bacterium]